MSINRNAAIMAHFKEIRRSVINWERHPGAVRNYLALNHQDYNAMLICLSLSTSYHTSTRSAKKRTFLYNIYRSSQISAERSHSQPTSMTGRL